MYYLQWQVDYEEYIEGMTSFRRSDENALRFCFDVYDRDGVGCINLDQLKSVLSCVMQPRGLREISGDTSSGSDGGERKASDGGERKAGDHDGELCSLYILVRVPTAAIGNYVLGVRWPHGKRVFRNARRVWCDHQSGLSLTTKGDPRTFFVLKLEGHDSTECQSFTPCTSTTVGGCV